MVYTCQTYIIWNINYTLMKKKFLIKIKKKNHPHHRVV